MTGDRTFLEDHNLHGDPIPLDLYYPPIPEPTKPTQQGGSTKDHNEAEHLTEGSLAEFQNMTITAMENCLYMQCQSPKTIDIPTITVIRKTKRKKRVRQKPKKAKKQEDSPREPGTHLSDYSIITHESE